MIVDTFHMEVTVGMKDSLEGRMLMLQGVLQGRKGGLSLRRNDSAIQLFCYGCELRFRLSLAII